MKKAVNKSYVDSISWGVMLINPVYKTSDLAKQAQQGETCFCTSDNTGWINTAKHDEPAVWIQFTSNPFPDHEAAKKVLGQKLHNPSCDPADLNDYEKELLDEMMDGSS